MLIKEKVNNGSPVYSEEKQAVPLLDLNTKHGEHAHHLNYHLLDYLELIDWVGRIIREDKRGAIPVTTPHILTSWKQTIPAVLYTL